MSRPRRTGPRLRRSRGVHHPAVEVALAPGAALTRARARLASTRGVRAGVVRARTRGGVRCGDARHARSRSAGDAGVASRVDARERDRPISRLFRTARPRARARSPRRPWRAHRRSHHSTATSRGSRRSCARACVRDARLARRLCQGWLLLLGSPSASSAHGHHVNFLVAAVPRRAEKRSGHRAGAITTGARPAASGHGIRHGPSRDERQGLRGA